MKTRESDYKLKFTLKQHTPIIHFQPNQIGATLRISELKPKLDKFLLRKKAELLDCCRKGKQGKALNYDVVIDLVDKTKTIEKNTIDYKDLPYFGSIGGDTKKYLFNSGEITVEFFSYYSEVLDAIEDYFPEFIALTNFGTRQSKGFGSFSIDKIDIGSSLPKPYYQFTVKSDKWWKALEQIDLFYRMLRGGINHKYNDKNKDNNKNKLHDIFYGKSLLWLYATDPKRNWTWDKKAIKHKWFGSQTQKEMHDRNNPDIMTFAGNGEHMLRDLLGLSSEESWYTQGDIITKEVSKITRYRSPITFRPIKRKNMEGEEEFVVYFYADEIPYEILHNTFNVQSSRHPGEPLPLKPPSTFKLTGKEGYLDFVASFAEENKFSDHIEPKFHHDPPEGFPDDLKEKYKSRRNIYNKLSEVFNTLTKVES